MGLIMMIDIVRYTDPERLNLARNAAIYLGKEDHNNVRRPLSILRMGHTLEIFRGEFVEFMFNGLTKEVYDHLTTYTTRNMRVACGNRAKVSDGYSLPLDKMKYPDTVHDAVNAAYDLYRSLAETESPQVARSAMPCGAHMNTFVLQFNFATLIQAVFPQRLWSKGAQGATRAAVEEMFNLCKEFDSELWRVAEEYFGHTATDWMHAYRKLKKTEEGMRIIDKIISDHGKTKSMWE